MSVPVPDLVKEPLPVMLPLKAVVVLSPPAVRRLDWRSMAPAPAMEPRVSLPPSWNAAATATASAEELPRRSSPCVASVPELTSVAPELVLAPSRTRVAAPFLVREPLPERVPEYVPLADWSKTKAALLAMLPWRLSVFPVRVPAETVVPPV